MINESLASTHVFYGGSYYVVSTINRLSSALIVPAPVYTETLVWTLDADGCLDRVVYQAEGPRDSIVKHCKMVERLFMGGLDALESNNGE